MLPEARRGSTVFIITEKTIQSFKQSDSLRRTTEGKKHKLTKQFLIVKYILYLKKKGIPPLVGSLLFGGIFFLLAYFGFIYYGIPISFGYFSCLAWLFIGPWLIYRAGKAVSDLWPQLTHLLDKDKIESLSHYEEVYHGRGYFVLSIPSTIIVSVIIFCLFPFGALFNSYSTIPFAIFYYFSWVVLAFLGCIGIWGIVTFTRMIKELEKYEVNLNPFHHDRFGGLRVLSDFGVKITIFGTTGALMIPMIFDTASKSGYTANQIFVMAIIGSTFFTFAVYLSFFIQIRILHRIAVKGKNRLMEQTEFRIKALDEKFQKRQTTSHAMQLLVNHNYFDKANSISVYPFDVEITGKLSLALVVSLLVGTLRIWFPWLPEITV